MPLTTTAFTVCTVTADNVNMPMTTTLCTYPKANVRAHAACNYIIYSLYRWQLHYLLSVPLRRCRLRPLPTYILCCWKLHYLASVPHTPMYICRWQLYHLVSVPLTPLSTFMGRWIFGEVLCKIFPWSQVKANSNFLGRTTQGVREGLIKSGTNKKRERRKKGEREKDDLLHIEKNIYKWEYIYGIYKCSSVFPRQ